MLEAIKNKIEEQFHDSDEYNQDDNAKAAPTWIEHACPPPQTSTLGLLPVVTTPHGTRPEIGEWGSAEMREKHKQG